MSIKLVLIAQLIDRGMMTQHQGFKLCNIFVHLVAVQLYKKKEKQQQSAIVSVSYILFNSDNISFNDLSSVICVTSCTSLSIPWFLSTISIAFSLFPVCTLSLLIIILN